MQQLINGRSESATLDGGLRQKIYELYRSNPYPNQRADWGKLETELDRLPEYKANWQVPIRNIAKVCNNKLGRRRILEQPTLLILFKQVLRAFVHLPTFTDIPKSDDKKDSGWEARLVLKNLQAVFGIWIIREYPQLGYLLLHPYFPEKYSGLLDIPFAQFVRFTPAFVLYRLGALSEVPKQIIWIRWMARGKNIRKAPFLTMPLSSREAHWLTKAPIHSTFGGAFFYGIVKARGGSDELFYRLFNFYRSPPNDRRFLDHLIHFLSRFQAGSKLNKPAFSLLMTYVEHHRQERLPFSLKGRSLDALLRHANEWEIERRRQAHVQWLEQYTLEWPKVSIPGMEQEQGKYKMVISQLNSQLELYKEGLEMHHCVASYAHKCITGQSSIWSLRRYDKAGEFKRLATLEVNEYGELIQAYGPYNASPKKDTWKLIHHWTKLVGLRVNLE